MITPSRAFFLSEMARFFELSGLELPLGSINELLPQQEQKDALAELSDRAFFENALKQLVRRVDSCSFNANQRVELLSLIEKHFPHLQQLYDTYQNEKLVFEYDPLEYMHTLQKELIFGVYEEYANSSAESLCTAYAHNFNEFAEDTYRFLFSVMAFERFNHVKFTGHKRFSIEGSEGALLALYALKILFFKSKTSIVVGMSHRGRLAAMATVFSKPLHSIFLEFMDADWLCQDAQMSFRGDVKYHRGFSHSLAKAGPHILLLPNASHLESIYPIALGVAKGKQCLDGEDSWIPLVFHGDASITGQGVVYETLHMNRIVSSSVGGVIHIIVDNQLGFTATASETRSTPNPTDVFRAFSIPVIHVKNECPLSVLKASLIAYEIRKRFRIDVAIRVVGYRKWGHNEADDPTITQPFLYKNEVQFSQAAYHCLRKELQLSDVLCNEIESKIQAKLQAEYDRAEEIRSQNQQLLHDTDTVQQLENDENYSCHNILRHVYKALSVPKRILLHTKVQSVLDKRLQILQLNGERAKIDWAFAEFVALSAIVSSGFKVRLIGQDVERGTFTQRHFVVVDQQTEEKWSLLSSLGDCQIHNSTVSEYGTLGFEYGFSIAIQGRGIVIWEAQFGDFANSAQIIIDQYITAAYEKWSIISNLVLLLPHGYEGQGPEHSSCRLERFLSLAVNNNITIAYPANPSTYAQLLVNQVKSDKPLIVLTPKSMLRDYRAVSVFSDCYKKRILAAVIMNEHAIENENVTKVFIGAGKFVYDVVDIVDDKKKNNIAVISTEVLYPFPEKDLRSIIYRFPNLSHIIWVQEEPVNMGAHTYMYSRLKNVVGDFSKLTLSCVTRGESASPATGYQALHREEREKLINQIYTLVDE